MLFCYIFFPAIFHLPVMALTPIEFSPISVSYSNEFPHYSDRLFFIQFSPRIGNFPTFSLLIFIIKENLDVLKESNVLETAYFNPGFSRNLEHPFNGQYFDLPIATVLRNNSINLHIKFKEKANFKHFEIRYGEYESIEKRDFAKMYYLQCSFVKYSKTIYLYIRTHLEMKTLTLDGRVDGVLMDEPAFLFCRGTKGYPDQRVEISGQEQYQVIDREFNIEENSLRIKALFQLHNHKSRFQCYTSDSRAEMEVLVFHHPTTLHLEPAYYSTVPNKSEIKCIADDGYPQPKIRWDFLQGPSKHIEYFNTYENQLFILSNAPIDSFWAFNCVAENTIPYSRINSTSLLFQFSIVNSSINPLILFAASAGAVVMLLALIVGLVIIFLAHSKRSQHPPSKYSNQSTGATVRKELAFDPDTAGSLHFSQSTECLPDELPKYEDTELDNKLQQSKMLTKDTTNTCYV